MSNLLVNHGFSKRRGNECALDLFRSTDSANTIFRTEGLQTSLTVHVSAFYQSWFNQKLEADRALESFLVNNLIYRPIFYNIKVF